MLNAKSLRNSNQNHNQAPLYTQYKVVVFLDSVEEDVEN